jgi:hypothetical protein
MILRWEGLESVLKGIYASSILWELGRGDIEAVEANAVKL